MQEVVGLDQTGPVGFVKLYAKVAAVAAFFFAPLLALSYFATADGAGGLETPTVSAWAEPGRELLGGLLTFTSPDQVYTRYLQLFALLFPAIVISAWTVRKLRAEPRLRLERWGWRLALPGYALMGGGLLFVALALAIVPPSNAIVNVGYLAAVFPGLLIGTVGSTLLGIGFVRSAFRPRATAWLLALSFPLWVVGSFVLGHNSIGLLPLFVAWAMALEHRSAA